MSACIFGAKTMEKLKILKPCSSKDYFEVSKKMVYYVLIVLVNATASPFGANTEMWA